MAFLSPSMITTMDQAKKHRTWALWILIIVYIFNFIDRQIVNILQEDIKADLKLTDTQLGMMTGLTFAVDKFKGWPHSGHVTLARGERSRLADFASEVL